MPLDGQFRDNVIIQVKNGRSTSAREPFSPVRCNAADSLIPELQITEYLGFSNHVYLYTVERIFGNNTHCLGDES